MCYLLSFTLAPFESPLKLIKKSKKYVSEKLEASSYKDIEGKGLSTVLSLLVSVAVSAMMKARVLDKIFTERRLSIAFMFLFISTLLLELLGFSVFYYSFYKIDPASFSNARNASLLNWFFFSISMFTTVNITNIIPLSNFSRIMVSYELFVAIILLIVLVTSFSMLAPAETKRATEELKTEAKELDKVVSRFLKPLKRLDEKAQMTFFDIWD